MNNGQQIAFDFEPCEYAGVATSGLGPFADDRLAVAQENIGPIERLAARFPVIRRLAGERSFRAVARRYVVSEPRDAADSAAFGDTFPHFLRRQGDTTLANYVADIAELEMLRGKAERAPYIRPLGRKALSVLQARPETMRVALHPSVFLLQSQFPVVMIWQNNRSADGRAIRRWSAEAALIARPFLEVIVCRLPPGGYAFIAALSVGQSVAAAEAAVAAVAADFNVASMLTLLADVQVVAGLRELNLRGARSA